MILNAEAVKQLDLDPERLVFIDETWTATNMTAVMAAPLGASA